MKEIEIQIMEKQMMQYMMLILNYMLSTEYTAHSKKTASCTPEKKMLHKDKLCHSLLGLLRSRMVRNTSPSLKPLRLWGIYERSWSELATFIKIALKHEVCRMIYGGK